MEVIFREEKLDLLGLTETKLKGNGEVCCGVNDIVGGIQEMERAREWGCHPVEQCVAHWKTLGVLLENLD